MDRVIDFINVNRERYLDELKALLAIPSISALPEHTADVKRCAEWCGDEMRRIGLQNVKLIDTPGFPVVYGDWLGRPARRRFSSTATTTCSPSIRSISGRRRPLKPPCATAKSTRAAPPTTRARCSCTSRPSRRT